MNAGGFKSSYTPPCFSDVEPHRLHLLQQLQNGRGLDFDVQDYCGLRCICQDHCCAITPSPLQRLHGFGCNGIVRIPNQRWTSTASETGNTAEVEEDTAASALLLKHEFLDGGADDVTLATLGEVLLEPTLTTLGNFLVRSNSQSSVALASLTVGGFQLEGYAMTLSAFAWNIVRTYTLTPAAAGTGWARPPTW